MSAFIYIVTEGVHDVTFVSKVLTVVHGGSRMRKLEDLAEPLQKWVGQFKWPNPSGAHHDISRFSVPGPAFYRLANGDVVALRNAQGITEIGKTLIRDLESFARASHTLQAVGVVLDADDKPHADRYAELKKQLTALGLAAPDTLGVVGTGSPRVGSFAMPAPDKAGTLEDVLLALGAVAYPELAAAAGEYVSAWHAKVASDGHTDWKELKKPAGQKKATIGAMSALLKPGKAMQVSLDDNRWIGDTTKDHAALAPCLAFLSALLTPPAVPAANQEATP